MTSPMPKATRATREPTASTSSPEIHHERVVTVDLIADRGRLRKGGSAEGRPQGAGGACDASGARGYTPDGLASRFTVCAPRFRPPWWRCFGRRDILNSRVRVVLGRFGARKDGGKWWVDVG